MHCTMELMRDRLGILTHSRCVSLLDCVQCHHLCVLKGLNFLHFLTDGWEQEGKNYIRPFPVCERSKVTFVISASLALSLSADL